MLQRHRKIAARASRTALVGLALFGYLAAAIGMPLSVRAIKKSFEPFPCQSRGCGCMSADQCRHACCCSKPTEQRAGAAAALEENPPEEANGWNNRPLREQACARTTPSCTTCKKDAEWPPASSCCHKVEKLRPSGSPRVHWMIGNLNQKCRGLQTLWIQLGAVLTPPSHVEHVIDRKAGAWMVLHSDKVLSLSVAPPTPPPRAV